MVMILFWVWRDLEQGSKLRTATFAEGSVRNACKCLFRYLDQGTTGGVQREKRPTTPLCFHSIFKRGIVLFSLGWMDSELSISSRMPSSSG